jgi:hypothetical protein
LKALDHYEDLADIKRAIVHPNVLQTEVYLNPTNTYTVPNVPCISVARQLFRSPDNEAIDGVSAGMLLADIKRVIVHTNTLQTEVYRSHQCFHSYFSGSSIMTTEQSIAYLQEMLCVNIHQHPQVVIQIAAKYLGCSRPTQAH